MQKTILFGIILVVFPKIVMSQILTESDLLGRWQCQSLMHASMPNVTGSFVAGWQRDSRGLAVILDNTELKFTSEKSGEYTLTSSNPNPFLYFSNEPVNSGYRVVNGQLVFTYNDMGANFLWEIRQIADGQMRLVPLGNGYYPTVSCNRVDSGTATTTSEPAAPTTTTAATTAKQDLKKSAKVE